MGEYHEVFVHVGFFAVASSARNDMEVGRLDAAKASVVIEFRVPSAKGRVVMVVVQPLCMGMRGVRKPNGTMVTLVVRGTFEESAAARAEWMSLIDNCRRQVPAVERSSSKGGLDHEDD